MKHLRSLQYYGGKQAHGRNGVLAKFIARTLPLRMVYIEPFAGMIGVLLRRPATRIEIINDLDDVVVNWWRVCLHQPEELEHAVWNTPNSEVEFGAAVDKLDAGFDLTEHGDVGIAIAFYTVCRQSIMHTGSGAMRKRSSYSIHWKRSMTDATPPDIMALNARLLNTKILHRDAVDILKNVEHNEDVSIYCDPPYGGTRNEHYGADVDREALADTLRRQSGAVIISGYGDEWDHLGWTRKEFTSRLVHRYGGVSTREQVAWMNFTPRKGLL